MMTSVPTQRRSSLRVKHVMRALVPALALLAIGSEAAASTLNQNVSWTIDLAGTTNKYRVVAYGDSIYAGYNEQRQLDHHQYQSKYRRKA